MTSSLTTTTNNITCVPCCALEEEERYAGPAGALLADNGGCACFLVSRLEVAPDGGAGGVEVEDARGVHDED